MFAAILALAAGSPARAVTVDPFAMGNPAFCTPKKPLRDFGLSKLPPVQEVPETADELGRPAVSIYGAFTRIMSEPEAFGYGFAEDRYDGPVKLDWTVTAQLWAVGSKGREFREVANTRMFIGDLDAAEQPHIALKPPKNRRGFYPFDIQFTDRRGQQLGSYSAYFKVVRPYWRVKLGLSRHVARVGEPIWSRIENLGTKFLAYGEEFYVEQLHAGRWERDPRFTGGVWLMWLGYLGPGSSGRCNVVTPPRDAAPGRYRAVKEVYPSLDPRDDPVRLLAPFRVIG